MNMGECCTYEPYENMFSTVNCTCSIVFVRSSLSFREVWIISSKYIKIQFRDFLRFFEIFWDFFFPSFFEFLIQSSIRPSRFFEIFRDFLRFFEIFWDFLRFFEIFWDFLRPAIFKLILHFLYSSRSKTQIFEFCSGQSESVCVMLLNHFTVCCFLFISSRCRPLPSPKAIGSKGPTHVHDETGYPGLKQWFQFQKPPKVMLHMYYQ